MYILSVYNLLKVVGYYDLSVLSMSVMGFPKKVWMGEWVGFFGGFLEKKINFAKPLSLLLSARWCLSLHLLAGLPCY